MRSLRPQVSSLRRSFAIGARSHHICRASTFDTPVVTFPCAAREEHPNVFTRAQPCQPAHESAAAHRIWIARVRERDRNGGPVRAPDGVRIECAACGAEQQARERTRHQREDHLGLGIAEADIELHHARPGGTEHDSDIERAPKW